MAVRLLSRLLLTAALAALAAPSSASLDSFDLSGGLGLRMPASTSGRVIARSGRFSICTDGVIKDSARARRLRGRDDHHQQRTALTTGGQQPLDPDVIPYFVLPRDFGGAQLGDLALVTYDGRSAWAVAGDRGPCEGCMVGRKKHRHPYRFGEGSTALARALGIPGADDGNGGGTSSGVSYLIFPGSAAPRRFSSERDLRRFIDTTGAELYARRFGEPRR